MYNLSEKNKFIFEKYQPLLLMLANSQEGRHILKVRSKNPIIQVLPNALIFDTGEYVQTKKGIAQVQQGHFYCYEKMAKFLLPYLTGYEILEPKQKPVGTREALEFFRTLNGLERSRKFPQIFMTTTSYYTSAADGMLLAFHGTWSTARGKASADIGYGTDSGSGMNLRNDKPDTSNFYLTRAFAPVDTSGIPDAAEITAANLNLYVQAIATAGANGFNMTLNPMTVANTASLAVGDFDGYDSIGSPAYWSSAVAHNAPSTSAFYPFAYNATGLAAISKTGFTHTGIRGSRDIGNTAPVDNPGSYGIRFEWSEGTNDPYHEITYLTSDIKKLSGITYANLKKVGGIAIANVKKVGGVQ